MTIEERLKFIDAGYSRAEIESMEIAAELPKEPAPDEEPKQEAVTEQPHQPEVPVSDTRMDKLEAALVKLTQAVQASNIINTGVPSAPTLTAEEALASLITDKKGSK